MSVSYFETVIRPKYRKEALEKKKKKKNCASCVRGGPESHLNTFSVECKLLLTQGVCQPGQFEMHQTSWFVFIKKNGKQDISQTFSQTFWNSIKLSFFSRKSNYPSLPRCCWPFHFLFFKINLLLLQFCIAEQYKTATTFKTFLILIIFRRGKAPNPSLRRACAAWH